MWLQLAQHTWWTLILRMGHMIIADTTLWFQPLFKLLGFSPTHLVGLDNNGSHIHVHGFHPTHGTVAVLCTDTWNEVISHSMFLAPKSSSRAHLHHTQPRKCTLATPAPYITPTAIICMCRAIIRTCTVMIIHVCVTEWSRVPKNKEL